MTMRERVTIKPFDTTEDAAAAEALLKENGVPEAMITRKGKSLSVDESYAGLARGLLVAVTPAGETPPVGEATASAADTVAATASTVGDTAHHAASAVAGTAQDVTATVVDTAKEAAGAVTDKVQDVTSTVTDKVQDVTSTVTSGVGKVADAAADKVEQLADATRQSAIGPSTMPGQRDVAVTAANVLDRTATYLRDGNTGMLLEDLRDVVRRHPIRSLALGLGLGYLARGTFFGGASVATGGSGRQSSGSSAGSPPPRPVPLYSDVATGTASSPGLTLPVDTGYSQQAPSAMSMGDVDTGSSLGSSSSMSLGAIDSPLVESPVADSMLYGTDRAIPADLASDDLYSVAGGTAGSTSTPATAGMGAMGTSGTTSSFGNSTLDHTHTTDSATHMSTSLSGGAQETNTDGSPWQPGTVDVVKQWNTNSGTSDS